MDAYIELPSDLFIWVKQDHSFIGRYMNIREHYYRNNGGVLSFNLIMKIFLRSTKTQNIIRFQYVGTEMSEDSPNRVKHWIYFCKMDPPSKSYVMYIQNDSYDHAY